MPVLCPVALPKISSIVSTCICQAKFRVPRNCSAAKELEGCWRPQLHLVACLVPSLVECYFILNCDLMQDSNMEQTLLSHTLDIACGHLRARNKAMPCHLHIQADNTCREMRNQQGMLWMASLVRKSAFKSATTGFMQVGHTHIDVDQRWARERGVRYI